MSLFQKSVLNNYLAQQDNEAVEKAYKKFTKYFHNPTIQKNIRESKEEQFQEGFLRELFVAVFGYTLNPNPNFNLTTEFKNQTGANKADGAILKSGNAIGVIELKGTKTKDLEKVRKQAFDYKANQPKCVYVITSNFEKLRFYIENAVDFEEFDLFHLTAEQFKLLYLCIYRQNILNDLPLQLKKASVVKEESITKEFYKDYSQFKRELYRDLVKNNVNRDVFRSELQKEDETRAIKNIKLTLFKKSQKLIDRFLFIFFAENRGLLPPNSTVKILEQWNKLKELDEYVPLYKRYVKYFNYLDTGRKGTDKSAEIFAYNGGLFKPDGVLDSLVIDDELLFNHTKTLSNYDFVSEVGVNILGHIFENSLNEIESVNAEIEGTDFEKQTTKRKKDGVFYTPKYITKYIVDNTVGKLCEEKKKEFGLVEDEYLKKRKGRSINKLRELQDILDSYRNWLLQISICDPACGSGAFLNQALDFLIKEHEDLDELNARLSGTPMIFQDIENTILENNIYGVDINEESVEIAKLSLWLRTAQPRRKLNDLNNNIKCGNSLIDSRAVAGDKAFKWEHEFPKVIDKGGFDVVIGNPPYVRQELLSDIKPYLERNYSVYEGTSDLFAYFYEKSFRLIKPKGVFGFISNTFDKTKAGKKLREYLSNKISFNTYIDFTEVQVFEGATTYPVILIVNNEVAKASTFQYVKVPKRLHNKVIDIEQINSVRVEQASLNSDSWNFHSVQENKLLGKIRANKSLREQFGKSFRGIVTGFNDAFIIDRSTKQMLEEKHSSSKDLIKPFFEGVDQSKWYSSKINKYIIFTRRGTKIDNYPAIKEYLEINKERLTPRNSTEIKIGRKPGPYKWFEIQDSVDYYRIFESTKITWPNLQSTNKFSIDIEGHYINAPSVVLPSKNKTILCILNSKISWFFLKSICVVRSGGYIEMKPQYIEQIPIPKLTNELLFEELADGIIGNTSKAQMVISKFTNYLQSQYSIEKLPRKLQNWDELEFGDFIKELNKAIKKSGGEKLTKSDEIEWMEVFETKKAEVQTLKVEINKTEREIDQMVYELYGLNEEEIKIVGGELN